MLAIRTLEHESVWKQDCRCSQPTVATLSASLRLTIDGCICVDSEHISQIHYFPIHVYLLNLVSYLYIPIHMYFQNRVLVSLNSSIG